MLNNDGFFKYKRIQLNEDESEEVNELLELVKAEPYFHTGGILYRYEIEEKDDETIEYIRQLGFACEVSTRYSTWDGTENFIIFSFIKNDIDYEFLLPIDVMLIKNVQQLFARGYFYDQKRDSEIAKYLTISEQLAPQKFCHSFVGLHEVDGKKVFALDKTVGDFESDYNGIFDLEPRGALDVWIDLIKDSVVGRTGLEFALCAGFSAMILNFLPEENQGECIFVNIGGSLPSSVGKSTGLMIGASIFGNPSNKGGRLLNTWRATDNALPILVGKDNMGVLVCFDEYGLRERKENIDFLYLFSQGRDKERSKSEGGLRENHQFCTTIMSSSEISILAAARNVKEGQLHRCIQFGNGFDFTNGADHADHIKSILINHYGHAAPLCAQFLLDNQEKIKEWYRKTHDKFKTILNTDDKLKLRVAKRYSIILLAGFIANKIFGFGMDIGKQMRLCTENIHDCFNDMAEDERALECLFQFVAHNNNKFPDNTQSNGFFLYDNIYGFYEKKKGRTQLVISAKIFEDVMREGGFEDPQKIVSLIKTRGLLDFEQGKTYRERKLCGKRNVKCYVIIFDESGNTDVLSQKPNAKIIDMTEQETSLDF